MDKETSSGSRFSRSERIQILILLAIAFLMGAWFYQRWHRLQDPWDPRAELRETGLRIQVQVSGDVKKPGVYELTEGSSVEELLKRSEAESWASQLPRIWLDMPLQDGASVQVWRTPEGMPQLSLNRMNVATMGLLFIQLDVNVATAEELEAMPGIGATTARAIIAYREAHGPFERLEDLTSVPGIGEKTVQSLRFQMVAGHRDSDKPAPNPPSSAPETATPSAAEQRHPPSNASSQPPPSADGTDASASGQKDVSHKTP